jgi:uncharacterized protein YoxC
VFIVISLVLLISLLYVLYSRRIITNNLKICKEKTVTKLQNVKQVIPELKQKIAKQTETIQSLGTHLKEQPNVQKTDPYLRKDVQGKSERLKSLMEKINRICETKENWDPDCEFKGLKTEQCHGKNEQRLYRKLQGQTEFSIRTFFLQA